jgi:chromate reductase, NAD(P)H dehydrogenase (quinone)
MTYTPKILAFAGSTRTDSYHKKLVKIAANGAKNVGAEVTFIDLRDYPMPLYDGDLEAKEGLPPNALKLKEIFWQHQGFLIASPEYNSSYSGVLKNTIDWLSRPASSDEPGLSCFVGRVAAIMSTSPGALGGLRGLAALRQLLENIQVIVLPTQVAVPKAFEVFNGEGMLSDAKQQASIEKLGENVANVVTKLNG